jgi:glycine amidinotransferase
MDVIMVPLRPPKGLHGTEGLAMYNPMWPPLKAEMELWERNNWKLIEGKDMSGNSKSLLFLGPIPATEFTPRTIGETRWLNLNLLSVSEKTLVIEECELPLYNMLTDNGFDVITAPMHNVYEFEGGIHCVTWDIRRDDACVDYFPDQSVAVIKCACELLEYFIWILFQFF